MTTFDPATQAKAEFYVELEPVYSRYGNPPKVISAKAVKMTKTKPGIHAGNVAVRLGVVLDLDVFPDLYPVLDTTLVADSSKVVVGEVEAEQLEPEE